MGSLSVQEGRGGRLRWAEIDLDALAHNVRVLKRRAGSSRLAAVVKANAYGHGAVETARAALAAGADQLAVICTDEGEQLRRAGIEAPILVLGCSPKEDAARIVEHGLVPTINSRESALALADEAASRNARQPIHLKVDTGLSRYGLPPNELIALAESLRGIPSLHVEGLFTHFACADEAEKGYTVHQYRLFTEVADRLSWIPVRHVSNTATMLDMPEVGLDLCRPGIGIYGCYPSPDVGRTVALRPVMSLHSRIARLTKLSPGESVSYGRTWRADRESTVALVMFGYGDGLPRALSNRGRVLVRGRRAPIVGRVCMDMSVVDVTDIPEAAVGDEVVLVGTQGGEEIPVDEVAEACGTINYEILSGITARVSRLYLRDGRVVVTNSLLGEREEPAPVCAG